MLPPNTILRARYRIINQLGHGGMGAVYQAMDENLSCVVAVKETFATTDEQRRAFRREAELLANLSHPALPRVTDHFTQDDGQFLVMQFVPGHDLAELLELREQPFPVAKVLDWADQLLDALEELHSATPPIIHRDIKPSNLKVTPKGKVLLLDFGLAKGFAGQMSNADADSRGKSIRGYTAHYGPLEQMRGAGTDQRSDLYSLAATLWTLLTGKIPPDALSRVTEKEEGNSDPLRPAHELNTQVPVHVSDALQRAMSLNRNQRQDTATELRHALGQATPNKREDESEQPTLHLPRAAPPGPTAPPPGSPPGPTVKAAELASPDPMPVSPHVPTIRVAALPAVPSFEPGIESATVSSFAGEDEKQRKPGKRLALIAAGALVVAISIVLVAGSGWRPWGRGQEVTRSTAPADSKSTNSSAAKATEERRESFRNQQGIEMVYIPPGSFRMGSSNGPDYGKPMHQVTINYPFYMGKYEVTQAQWQVVMGTNPSYFKNCADCPVEQVSWDEAQNLINKLNESNDGFKYRLPTEAEWEYACRAGTTEDYVGSLILSVDSTERTHPVGRRKPNAWGLADMGGNVWEWCEDWSHPSYDGAPSDGSPWLGGGTQTYRVLRGGTWRMADAQGCSATRHGQAPGDRMGFTGFRVVARVRTQ